MGKSTIINQLVGEEKMATYGISAAHRKGRHTTTHRELIVLPGRGILIDNPGMREVGISETREERTFDRITEFARDCRFRDCTHTGEEGCAVSAAVEQGKIQPAAHENYLSKKI